MIKAIRFKDGRWMAYSQGAYTGKLIDTGNYKVFKKFCEKHGLKLPKQGDIADMDCKKQYDELGGWRKLFV